MGFGDVFSFIWNQQQLKMIFLHDKYVYLMQLLEKRELSGRKAGQAWQGIKLKV